MAEMPMDLCKRVHSPPPEEEEEAAEKTILPGGRKGCW